jgi:hypothetical protein
MFIFLDLPNENLTPIIYFHKLAGDDPSIAEPNCQLKETGSLAGLPFSGSNRVVGKQR